MTKQTSQDKRSQLSYGVKLVALSSAMVAMSLVVATSTAFNSPFRQLVSGAHAAAAVAAPDGASSSHQQTTSLIGRAGPIGATVPQGLQGVAGSVGAQGPVGPQGVAGQAGSPGPQGPVGPAGHQGEIGLPGLAGQTGPVGPLGPAGAVGPQGPMGAVGAIGPQGITGPMGPVGSQGPAGPQGRSGVTGPQGPIGPVGPVGRSGVTGPSGPIGPAGLQGAAGAKGATGATGATGPQGPAGPTGTTGTAGAQGPAGPSVLIAQWNGAIDQGGSYIGLAGGFASHTENAASGCKAHCTQWTAPFTGHLTQLQFNSSNESKSWTVVVRDNGAATVLTCSTGSDAGLCSDLASSVSVHSGDRLDVSIVLATVPKTAATSAGRSNSQPRK